MFFSKKTSDLLLTNEIFDAIIIRLAGMAQLVEQLIRNQQVIGSSPITSSKGFAQSCGAFFVDEFWWKRKQKNLIF